MGGVAAGGTAVQPIAAFGVMHPPQPRCVTNTFSARQAALAQHAPEPHLPMNCSFGF